MASRDVTSRGDVQPPAHCTAKTRKGASCKGTNLRLYGWTDEIGPRREWRCSAHRKDLPEGAEIRAEPAGLYTSAIARLEGAEADALRRKSLGWGTCRECGAGPGELCRWGIRETWKTHPVRAANSPRLSVRAAYRFATEFGGAGDWWAQTAYQRGGSSIILKKVTADRGRIWIGDDGQVTASEHEVARRWLETARRIVREESNGSRDTG